MTTPPPSVRPDAAWHRRRRRRAMARAAVAGLLLHTLAVGWIWVAWEPGLRGGILVWMDLPASLLYLGGESRALFGWSLAIGGLEWAFWGALLSAFLSRTLNPPPRPETTA